MRTGARVPEEGADFVGRFRRENMFELAGLLLDFRFAVHGQAVGKKALSQPVATDDAASSLAAPWGQFHDQRPIACRCGDGFESIVARIDERLVLTGMRCGAETTNPI
jgi:hypothetical protein